jgi:hypothetical protein
LREAMAKAQGTGLVAAADRRDRVPGGAHDGFRQLSIGPESWQILQQTLAPDFSLAVALREAVGAVCAPVLQWWSADTVSGSPAISA